MIDVIEEEAMDEATHWVFVSGDETMVAAQPLVQASVSGVLFDE